jgi:carbamoyl-phosphate synthase large subunit
LNFIELAVRCMLGEHPETTAIDAFELPYVGTKASQFSFSRLGHADPVLGVDMASTGEVGCIGDSFDEALLKAMLSVGHHIPEGAILISSGDARQKADLLPACQLLHRHGLPIYATEGTRRFLEENGVPVLDGADALPLIRDHQVDLVINIPKNFTHGELTSGYRIRRAAIDFNVPLISDSRLATAFVRAFCTQSLEELPLKSWDEYKSE